MRLAWPQRKDIVQAHVRGKRGAPGSILNEAVGFLCELAQSDGRQDDYKRRKITDGSRAAYTDSKTRCSDSKPNSAKPKPKAYSSKANVAIV